MRRVHQAFWLICLTLFGSSAGSAQDEHCSTVYGRYAIYANNDFLWVKGSKHSLVVVIDDLDKQLEKMGWEQTAAFGDFVLCSDRAVDPVRLTIQDRVRVKSYSNVRLLRR
jgi:hypothetical protein